jgi:hypothetical protein
MTPRHLARLQRFHLLGRHQGILFLLDLLVDLPNPLLPLLGSQTGLGANGFDFGARLPPNRGALLHRSLGDARLLPARRLMHLRCTHYRPGMRRQRLLNMDRQTLRGCTLT